jgi:hypothetical protein
MTSTTTEPLVNPIVPQFLAARKVSVPLVVVRSTDPAATIVTLTEALLNGKTAPVITWDNINGLLARNTEGAAALDIIMTLPPAPGQKKGERLDATASIPCVEALGLIQKAPAKTVVFLQNAHRAWNTTGTEGAQIIQAIWNLRDLYKSNWRTLVLLTPTASIIPAELAGDVVVFEEPLPTKEQLADTVRSIYASVDQQAEPDTLRRAVDALAGARSAFMAEQATAMSMTASGVDIDGLWEQKRGLINDTPGLTYITPRMRFADLGGADAIKAFFTLLFNGAAAPSVIVMLDEIDDMFAGVGSDSSGVSTVLHGKFLTQMTKTGAKGAILMGHPGVGKTAILEAASAEFGVPLIALDFGDVKNGLVGASEERAATALKVIDAISFGRALYVGTCNSVGNLSPQLQRRFPWRFFFDLPTEVEKKAIWPVYEKRPHIDASGPLRADQLAERPVDVNWTGAEVKECCENAWRFDCTLREAANYVVPIAVSMPEKIDERRKDAANRYLSASYPGAYQLTGKPAVQVETKPVKVEPTVAVVMGRMPRGIADMKES